MARSQTQRIPRALIQHATSAKLHREHKFVPTGRPMFWTWDENPFAAESLRKDEPKPSKDAKAPKSAAVDPWGETSSNDPEQEGSPLVAKFTMGLSTGFGPDATYKAEAIRSHLIDWFPHGGKVAATLGWWNHIGESSIDVVIYNTWKGLSDHAFARYVIKLVGSLAETFRQREIWLDFLRDEKVAAGFEKGFSVKAWA